MYEFFSPCVGLGAGEGSWNVCCSNELVNAYCRNVGSISTNCFGCWKGSASIVRENSVLGT
jgi:hypothetical protein